MRRVVLLLFALARAGRRRFRGLRPVLPRTCRWPPTPEFKDAGERLPTQEEFEAIVRTDPVKMLEVCLTRYQREVKGGITAMLEQARTGQRRPEAAEGRTGRSDSAFGSRRATSASRKTAAAGPDGLGVRRRGRA